MNNQLINNYKKIMIKYKNQKKQQKIMKHNHNNLKYKLNNYNHP